MNTTALGNEIEEVVMNTPGAILAQARKERGYSQEYVASRLHLRVKIIALLETDDYKNMPEEVFIKGYLRAYANLLEMDHEPILTQFNQLYVPDHKPERALWQSRRASNRAEHIVRWSTTLFAVGVLIAVMLWWHANKENERHFPKMTSRNESVDMKTNKEITLTDLSKMRSLLSTNTQYTELEKPSE